MVHHRERLPLRVEAGEHFGGSHPLLDDLYRNAATNGAEFFSLVDDPHAALSEHLENAIWPDALGRRTGRRVRAAPIRHGSISIDVIPDAASRPTTAVPCR